MADVVKLAVLIDADNAKAENVEPLMAEIAKYGVASVKRAYGNWTTPNLGGWKQVLVEHSIQPMQQFSYTVGKNSTDSALIIDAMDLLYTGRFGGFCLISSDSDFTRLAQRIREAGLLVYGFGERKTPTSLVSACDKFVYMDLLRESAPAGQATSNEPRPKRGEQRPDGKLLQIFKAAVDAASDEEGWANLGAIGNHVSKRAPDFDSRNYGFKKLSELLRSLSIFEWEERKAADGKGRAMLLRHRSGNAGASASVNNAIAASSTAQATSGIGAHSERTDATVAVAARPVTEAASAPALPAAAHRPAQPQKPAQQAPRPESAEAHAARPAASATAPVLPSPAPSAPVDRPFMPGLLNADAALQTEPTRIAASPAAPPALAAGQKPASNYPASETQRPPQVPKASAPALAPPAAVVPQAANWNLPPPPQRQMPKQVARPAATAPVLAAPAPVAVPKSEAETTSPGPTVELPKAAPAAAKPARAAKPKPPAAPVADGATAKPATKASAKPAAKAASKRSPTPKA